MSRYVERAKELRTIEIPHYNCAQAVVIPFCEDAGIDEKTAYRFAAAFGGGMKSGSVCGAVTGGVMALGLFGIDDPETLQDYFARARAFMGNDMDCRTLLRKNEEAGGIKKPFCDGLVLKCTALTEEILREKQKL